MKNMNCIFLIFGFFLTANINATPEPDYLDETDHTKYPTVLSEHMVISNTGSGPVSNSRIPIYEVGDGHRVENFSFGEDVITREKLQQRGVIFEKDEMTDDEFQKNSDAPVVDPIDFIVQGNDLPDTEDTLQRSIIGWDMRQRLYTNNYPARSTTLITFNTPRGGGRCSGTMIGPNTVATAGHCLYGRNWYTNVRVYPGSNGSSTPFGFCTARSLHTVVGWAYSHNERYDYGAIKLNCNVGNVVGWSGFTNENPYSQAAIIQGYPGDKPLTQWTSSDKVRATTTRQVFYSNDTTGGMSGSGVWYDKLGPYLIGIHGYRTHGSIFQWRHRRYNHGVRINNPVFYNLLSWKYY